MIVLREYRESDLKSIKNILDKEGVKDSNLEGIIYVILNNNNILGVSKVELKDGKSFLKYLIIEKKERESGFGDALIRATINKLKNNKIDKIYFEGSSKYLLKKGFEIEAEDILFLDINNFFNSNCNCSGGCHEIQGIC